MWLSCMTRTDKNSGLHYLIDLLVIKKTIALILRREKEESLDIWDRAKR